jgi:DNA-binding transcriptional ArsR family regulator
MSRPTDRRPGDPDRAAGASAPPETILALLSDESARSMLAALRREPRSARALAEACGVSRATAYRRLDRLQAAGLVAERLAYDEDGHHRRTYRLAVDRVWLELGESGFAVDCAATDPPARRE